MENNENQTERPPSFLHFADVNEFSQQSLRAVLTATKSSNDLPVGDDFDFYSTYRSVRDVLDIEGQRILSLLQRLLRQQNVKGNLIHGDLLELEEQFDILMDANDQILERAGTLLDDASGVNKQQAQLIIAAASDVGAKTSSWNKKSMAESNKPSVAYRLMTARNIQRPQLSFRDKIDNTNRPYKPQLREKPNALKPLEESLKLPENVSLEDTEDPNFIYPHPYLFELESYRPDPLSFEKISPKEPQPLDKTPLIHVDTKSQLQEMLDDLKMQTEIAVDLEHHSYRSFQGLTCLMQISTRQKDYIIDTLALRNDLHVLNNIFTDHNITKVFHGADSDIQWLQRDFGVYVVNMFDTGQAARVLGFSRFSLAHLMMNYCHIEADKQFQLADWRIRPLPAELINYAREDTHYLLYIFDLMRNQLLERGNAQSNLLLSVYERSKNVAAKVYQKPIFSPHDFLELYKKSKKVFNNQQLTALKEIYSWRDSLARMEDESLGYVLPNHMLLQIAEILPRERQGVLACCNPIPPLVRQSLIELHNIVLQARELTPTKIEKLPDEHKIKVNIPTFESNSVFSCPHDKSHLDSHLAEIEKQILETGLISSSLKAFNSLMPSSIIKPAPVITALANAIKPNGMATKLVNKIKACISNPFFQYLSEENKDSNATQPVEIWHLKPSNVPQAQKQKAADVLADENSWHEFVPPAKRAKTEDDMIASGSGSSNVFTSKKKSHGNKRDAPGDGEGEKLSQDIEVQIKTLRQEVISKKKKQKKLAKKHNFAKSVDKNKNNSNDITPKTPDPKMAVEKTKSEKKKKKKNAVPEMLENFKSFNYDAAEKSFLKENAKKKTADIYNPNFPSGKKKNKVRKPKLSGPKSNMSYSFDPSASSSKKKKH